MREQTLRTVGATVVLFGIAIAAVMQIGPGGDPSAIALTADSDTPSSTVGAGETTASAPEGTTPLPEPFVYRVGVLSGVSTTNYWAFYADEPSVWNSYILGPTKAALFAVDPTTGRLQPELATTIVEPTKDESGWHVRLELRSDLAWSDGLPITASDVAFTFNTVRRLGLEGSWSSAFPASVESVAADGDGSLTIRFSERPTIQVWPHGPGLAPIMSEAYWQSRVDGSDASALLDTAGDGDPAGGPLAIDVVDAAMIRSTANPGYTVGGGPDVVEYLVFESEAEAVSALDSGSVDFFLTPKGLTQADAETLSSNPAIEITSSPANAVRYLGFNLNREPMSDINFRSALALLIDREVMAGGLPGGAELAYAVVSEHNERWASPEGLASNTEFYDGSLSSRLEWALVGLRASGYTWQTEPSVNGDGDLVAGEGLLIDGLEPAPLTILTPGDQYDELRPAHAAQIAGTLALLGFDVRPVETDFDSVVDLAFTPDDEGLLHYDMYLLGWTLGSPVWPGFYGSLFASDGVANNTGYASEVFDTALASYEGAHDMDQAVAALWEMENVLARELPYLVLYSPRIAEAHRLDRVTFDVAGSLGGIQGRLGGILDVAPVG